MNQTWREKRGQKAKLWKSSPVRDPDGVRPAQGEQENPRQISRLPGVLAKNTWEQGVGKEYYTALSSPELSIRWELMIYSVS